MAKLTKPRKATPITDKIRVAYLVKNCLSLTMLLDGSWNLTCSVRDKVANIYEPDIVSVVDSAIRAERKGAGK